MFKSLQANLNGEIDFNLAPVPQVHVSEKRW